MFIPKQYQEVFEQAKKKVAEFEQKMKDLLTHSERVDTKLAELEERMAALEAARPEATKPAKGKR